MEKIKISFCDKFELQTFTRLVSDLILLHQFNMLYLDYYNAVEFLRVLQKKSIDVCFSDRKKFTLRITPNHAHALDILVSRNCADPKLYASVIDWNLVTMLHKQAQDGYERISNAHNATAAAKFSQRFLKN
jgi:hypothetical protein